MLTAAKYRLYPTKEQEELLIKHFGCVRLVYNLALEAKAWAWSSRKVNLSRFELSVQLKELKQTCEWLKEVNSQSLQAALLHLDSAYRNFFNKTGRFPRFKSKHHKQSFHCPQYVQIAKGRLLIPKFREGIRLVLHRRYRGTIRNATISRTPTGKYYVAVLTETGDEFPPKLPVDKRRAVGIDVGLKTFAVLSTGTAIANPRHLRGSLERLKVLQRRASRRKRGSAGRKKAMRRVAALHERTANQRNDFLHKASDAITKQYDTICVEELLPKNMVKNHHLALSIQDAGWGKFYAYLRYKSAWRGKNLLTAGRFDPSSKRHNRCGYINKELSLNDRRWRCPHCRELVDRDQNAAKNILEFALSKHAGMGHPAGPVESLAVAGAVKQEKFRRALPVS